MLNRIELQVPPRDTWNGDLSGFHLRYMNVHSQSSRWNTLTISSRIVLEQNITDLNFQERYLFQMQTYNVLGTSDWSKPTFFLIEVGRKPAN